MVVVSVIGSGIQMLEAEGVIPTVGAFSVLIVNGALVMEHPFWSVHVTV